MKKLWLLGLLMAVSNAVFAFPTIYGWSGGVEVPTASAQTGWAIAANNSTQDNPVIPTMFLTAGVIPNLEISAGFSKPDTGSKDGLIGAKYVLPFDLLGGKTAVGAAYNVLDTAGNGDKIVDLYASGTFPIYGCDLTLAADCFQEKMTTTTGGVTTRSTLKKLSPQIALAKKLDKGGCVGLEGVFNTGGDNYANAFVIVPLSDRLMGRLAWSGINSSDGVTTLIGVEYTFAGK